jgi:hypothetical protein
MAKLNNRRGRRKPYQPMVGLYALPLISIHHLSSENRGSKYQ